MTCGQCNSPITAQWAKRKSGGLYRCYRCTKKRGICSQKYIQEKDLAAQIRAQLQSVALPDTHTDWMLKRVDEWEKEQTNKSQSSVQNIKSKITETQEKLDKLVSAYIDGDIPKESYLSKKEELLKPKVSLTGQKTKPTTRNPLEPLHSWILDTKKASFLAFSNDYPEMKQIIQKIGTNPKLSDRSLSFSFIPPSDFLASRLAGRAPTIPFAPLARPDFSVSNSESIFLSGCGESNPVNFLHPMQTCCRYTTARWQVYVKMFISISLRRLLCFFEISGFSVHGRCFAVWLGRGSGRIFSDTPSKRHIN